MNLAERLLEAGGVARWRDLADRPEVDAALEAGLVVRSGRGVISLPDADSALRAARVLNGALTGVSAAMAHGWPVKLPPDRPQVVVPRGRKVASSRRVGVDLKWGAASEREIARGCVDPVHAVLECARWEPFDSALAVADSALRSGLGRGTLLIACQHLPRDGRARAFRVVECADGRSANPFESVVRAVVLDIPGLVFEPQIRIANIGRPDLVDLERRIVIECDSHQYHSDPIAFARDMERYNALVAEGFTVLRFAWRHAMFEPDYIRAAVIGALGAKRLSTRAKSA